MEINKQALKLLELANKKETVNFEDPEVCAVFKESVHQPYMFEYIADLKKSGFVYTHAEMVQPEGYQFTTFRISPAGQAYLEAVHSARCRNVWSEIRAWGTLAIAILAFIKSFFTCV